MIKGHVEGAPLRVTYNDEIVFPEALDGNYHTSFSSLFLLEEEAKKGLSSGLKYMINQEMSRKGPMAGSIK